MGVLMTSVSAWRNDRFTALIQDAVTQAVGFLGPVGEDLTGARPVDQIAGRGHIVLQVRPREDTNQQAQGVYADVDLSSEAAARPAKRLGVRSLPFSPRAGGLGMSPDDSGIQHVPFK